MARPLTTDMEFTLRFGGGVNSAASEDDVSPSECTFGENFTLDYKNKNLKPRKPLEKLGAAPNNQEIRGFVNLLDSDGAATILVQAGSTVYKWSQTAGFMSVGTCNASCRLRGRLEHYWSLDDIVIVTDLNLISPVLIWNGSALSTMTHNLAGDFKAKYCWVDDERARFGNIVSNSIAVPHMIVTSKLSNYNNLSDSSRASSALGNDDPYYLLTPDLRPVNGLLGFYDNIIISSERGSIFKIAGTDASDTYVTKMYPRSAATGRESITYTGNDVFLGRVGRIESLISTDNYGDVAIDDVTIPIKPEIADLANWQGAYNPRTQKVYYHAVGSNHIWQYSKDLESSELSPWVKLTTQNAFGMNPTAMMTMLDPTDGLEYVYMGDSLGNLYKIEGDEGALDAGENSINVTWRSGILKTSNELIAENFSGYVSYRSGVDTQITIKFLFGGSYVSSSEHIIPLKGTTGGIYYGGNNYFGGNAYFGVPFSGSFRREAVTPAGQSEEIQIEVSHTGSADFEINEIGLRFEARTNP